MADTIAQLLPRVVPHDRANELTTGVISRLLGDRDSATRQVLDTIQKDSIVSLIKQREERSKIVISFKMTSEQKALLEENYPEYTFTFTDTTLVGHPFAAASRICETNRVISDSLNVHNYRDGLSPHIKTFKNLCDYQKLIISVGGNPVTHIEDYDIIHSCDPILGHYDACRQTLRSLKLFTSGSMTPEQLDKYLYGDEVHCKRKFQDCSVTAPFAVGIQSCYDIPLQELVDTMDKKKIYTFYGTIIYEGTMLLEDVGVLKPLDVRYQIDRVRRTIRFTFEDDSSFGYEHNLDNYMSYIANPVIVSKSGVAYVKELTLNRAGVQYFRIVRGDQDYKRNLVGEMIYTVPFKSKSDMIVINYFDWDYAAVGSDRLRYKLIPKKLYMRTQIYQFTMQYILNLQDNKFTPAQVYEFYRSASNIVVSEAVFVKNHTFQDAEKAFECSYAMYMHAYAVRYGSGRVLQELVELEKKYRAEGEKSLFKKFISYLMKGPTIIPENPYKSADKKRKKTELIEKPSTKLALKEMGSLQTPALNYQKMDLLHELHHWFFLRLTQWQDFRPYIELAAKHEIIESAQVRVKVNPLTSEHLMVLDDKADNLFEAIKGEVENAVQFDLKSDDQLVMVLDKEAEPGTKDDDTTDAPNTTDSAGSESELSGDEDIGSVQYKDGTWSGKVTKCTISDHSTSPNKGQGNCLYYALLGVDDDLQVNQLKLSLLESGLIGLYSESIQKELKQMLSKPLEWGDLSVIDLYARYKSVTVYVHTMEDQCVARRFGDTGTVMHLMFRSNHYERIITPVESLLATRVARQKRRKTRNSVVQEESGEKDTSVQTSDFSQPANQTSVVDGKQQVTDLSVINNQRQRSSSESKSDDIVEETREFFRGQRDCVSLLDLSKGGSLKKITEELEGFLKNFLQNYIKLKIIKATGYKVLKDQGFLYNKTVPDNRQKFFSQHKFLVYVGTLSQCQNSDYPYIDTLLIIPDGEVLDKNVVFHHKPTLFTIPGFVCFWFRARRPMNASLTITNDLLISLSGFDADYKGFIYEDDEQLYTQLRFPDCQFNLYNLNISLKCVDKTQVCDRPLLLFDYKHQHAQDTWVDIVSKQFGTVNHTVVYNAFKPLPKVFGVLVPTPFLYNVNWFLSAILINRKSEIEDVQLWFSDHQLMRRFHKTITSITIQREISTDILYEYDSIHAILTALNDEDFKMLSTTTRQGARSTVAWNNGERKFIEIYKKFSMNTKKFLDICAGPGGSTMATLKMFPHAKGLVHIYYDPKPRTDVRAAKSLIRHANVKIIPPNEAYAYNGDLLDEDQINYLEREVIERHHYDLVVADGYSQESVQMDVNLKLSEIRLALHTLAAGGTLIMKLHARSEDIPMFNMINGKFKHINILKPTSSNPLSREVYIVAQCRGFYPQHDLSQQLRSIVDEQGRFISRQIESVDTRKVQDTQPSAPSVISEELRDDSTCVDADSETESVCSDYVDVAQEFKNQSHIQPVKTVTFNTRPLKEITDDNLPPVMQTYPKIWKTTESWKRLDYNPHFEVNLQDANAVARNAAREIRAVWEHTPQILKRKYQYIYDRALHLQSSKINLSTQEKNYVKNHTNKLQLYNTQTLQKFFFKYDYKFNYAFDGEEFVEVEVTDTRIVADTAATWLLISDEMEVMNDELLFNSTMTIDMTYDKCKFIVVQGVPGCGKTHHIVTHYEPGDLVLSATREGKRNIAERISAISQAEADCCFTVHSYLINGGENSYKRVWVDEANMRHYGELVLVSMKAKAEEIILIGDSHQIPFFLRVPSIPLYFSSFHKFLEPSEYLNVSHRVPRDVAYAFASVYDGGFFTSSTVIVSMSIMTISNIMQVPKFQDKDHVYLTFKRAEKMDLQRKFGDNVFTIGEYQGSQANHVILVRLSVKPTDTIYTQKSQKLVALTRHTHSLTYYTMYDRDEICELIRNASSQPRCELSKVYRMKGGYVDVPSNLIVRCEKLIKVNENPIVHDVIDLAMGTSVAPLQIKRDYVLPSIPRRVIPLVNRPADVSILQVLYDELMPACSLRDRKYEQYVAESVPYVFDYSTVNLDISKHRPVDPEKRAHLRPVLRTAIAYNRQPTQRDAIIGLQKRNLDKPELSGFVDDEFFRELMVERFVETYINKDVQHLFHDLKSHPIMPNHESVTSWLEEQDTNVMTSIKEAESFLQNRLYMYNLMNKKTVKPKLDPTAISEYAAVQTIAYQKKIINMVFCPIFRELMRRLTAMLRPQFMMFTNMSPEQFADEFNRRFSGRVLSMMQKLEIDISKYDKSQDRLLLQFEIEMYRLLGLPDWLCDLWYHAHYSTVLHDRINGVKASVIYQRKSGDASTFFGNTLVLMGMLSTIYDMNNFVGVFSGDDSVLWGDDQLYNDMNTLTAEVFNLESKFFSYKYTYFCSKFIIFDGIKYHFVPDPLKLITKFGRQDLVSWEHLEEYRISTADLIKAYDDEALVLPLSQAFNERYKCNWNLGQVMATIKHLVSSRENFKSLFYLLPGDQLLCDPSLPDLD